MRILKPGDPCPCCGQPIKEGLPSETMILLSWLQEGKELRAAIESKKIRRLKKKVRRGRIG